MLAYTTFYYITNCNYLRDFKKKIKVKIKHEKKRSFTVVEDLWGSVFIFSLK